MNRILQQQVQRLGELRQKRKRLEEEENTLARSVRSQMSEHGLQAISSEEYEAKLITQQRLTVNPAAFFRSVTKKDFLGAVTVSVTAAREILGDRKLRKISEMIEAVQLRLAARRGRVTDSSMSDTASQETAM